MTTEAPSASPEVKIPTVSLREVHKVAVASLVGTSLEFYDFLLYGFVATTFATIFFPSLHPTAALLSTLATFAVGYAARPFGAFLFGHIGDRMGRRTSFVISLGLMAIASLLTAVLPTYYFIGIWAPTLLVIFRLLQGLAVGGELGPGITIIGEYAPKEHRGFWITFTQISQFLGAGLATLGVLLLSLYTSPTFFLHIGWRILFGVGSLIGVAGGLSQWSISESPLYQRLREKAQKMRVPVAEYFTKYWKILLKVIGFSIAGTVTIYLTGVFAIVYLEAVIHVARLAATEIIVIGYVFGMIAVYTAGILSDRYGRRTMYIIALCAIAIFIYPYFYLLHTGVFGVMLIAQIIMTFFFGFSVLAITIVPELFPTRLRTTGVALSYNINTAIFGGTTPYIATALIVAIHWELAPVIWGAIAIATALLTMIFLIKETKGIDLDTIK